MSIETNLKRLPLHHIDTSIILEPKETANGLYCRKYLQKIGYNYRGILSFPVLSELFSIVLKIEDYTNMRDSLDIIKELINVRKIEFYSPKNAYERIRIIKEIDKRIDPLDREILASAIEHQATNLITLDEKLINNIILEKRFRMKCPLQLWAKAHSIFQHFFSNSSLSSTV